MEKNVTTKNEIHVFHGKKVSQDVKENYYGGTTVKSCSLSNRHRPSVIRSNYILDVGCVVYHKYYKKRKLLVNR